MSGFSGRIVTLKCDPRKDVWLQLSLIGGKSIVP